MATAMATAKIVPSSSLVNSLHPSYLPLVVECQRSDQIKGKIAVAGVKSSILNGIVDGNCDRFLLFIPYCGSYVKWEILFDFHFPTLPPDIIFVGENDSFVPFLDNLQSFIDWDVTNTQCLICLIQEILQEYRKHQLNSLSSYQQVQFQYATLKESYNEHLIDVQCVSGKSEILIKFFISLDVDYSAIPNYFKKDHPGNYYATLSIIFNPRNLSRVEKSLLLSPGLERVLGGEDCIKLPKWKDDTYLMDFLPIVNNLVQEKVNFLMESFIKRKEYLASILNVLGNSVLEYDTESYKMISLLFDYQGFCFIAQVMFADYFPKEIPLLSLFSIYHKIDGQPLQVSVSLPYSSSQTEADINIKKMTNYILQIAPQFMDICKSKGAFLQ